MKKQYGKWKVEETLKEDRCYLASCEGQKGAVKIGNLIDREINELKKLKHPNIVKLLDYDLKADVPYMVTEYHPLGVINDSLLGRGHFSGDERLEMCRMIKKAAQFCVDNGVIPHSLDQHNVVVREDGSPVLIDFEANNCFGPNFEENMKLFEHKLARLLWNIGGREWVMRQMI